MNVIRMHSIQFCFIYFFVLLKFFFLLRHWIYCQRFSSFRKCRKKSIQHKSNKNKIKKYLKKKNVFLGKDEQKNFNAMRGLVVRYWTLDSFKSTWGARTLFLTPISHIRRYGVLRFLSIDWSSSAFPFRYNILLSSFWCYSHKQLSLKCIHWKK